MRVGANVRQFHRIKKMHKEGVPADVIANSIPMTPQSLERIIAGLEGRPVKTLVVEESPEIQELRLANAQLAQKLAKYEDPQDGEAKVEAETVEAEAQIEDGEEVAAQEEVATDEST
jgi:hypothetical protein